MFHQLLAISVVDFNLKNVIIEFRGQCGYFCQLTNTYKHQSYVLTAFA